MITPQQSQEFFSFLEKYSETDFRFLSPEEVLRELQKLEGKKPTKLLRALLLSGYLLVREESFGLKVKYLNDRIEDLVFQAKTLEAGIEAQRKEIFFLRDLKGEIPEEEKEEFYSDVEDELREHIQRDIPKNKRHAKEWGAPKKDIQAPHK